MSVPGEGRSRSVTVLASGEGWHVRDLRRAATRHGLELAARDIRELDALVRDPPSRDADGGRLRVRAAASTLLSSDVVIVRTMPAGSLEQVIWRMDALHSAVAHGVAVINSPRALECAIDKYLSAERLARAGLPVPTTAACESPARALALYEELGGDVVVKPLFGSEGKGVERLRDRGTARARLTAITESGGVALLQRFVEGDGSDLRALVIGDRVVASMRRVAAPGEWVTNIARGARAEPVALDDEVRRLAVRACAAVGAEVGGVDVILDRDGSPHVLEVNAVPGWRALSAVTGLDVAAEILAFAGDLRTGDTPNRAVAAAETRPEPT